MSPVRISHVIRTNESCHTSHMNESCLTYEWVRSHIKMSHVTHTNESCHPYKQSCITHMNESYHAQEWVMSHMWKSHVAHDNESWHSYEPQHYSTTDTQWVMSHTRDWAIIHIQDCVTCEWVMTLIWDTTHSHVWHDSGLLDHGRAMRHVSHMWLSHYTHTGQCHMWMSHDTHTGHDSFTCVTWLIHICDMTHSHVWHDSGTLDHGRAMSHVTHMWMSHVTHMWMSHVTHMWMSHVTHMWMSHVTHMW